jgi:integrase
MCFPGRGQMKFTITSVKAATLPAGKSDHIEFDDDVAGFGLRLREGGSRTWVYQYRIGTKQRRMVLGSAKSVPLKTASDNARQLEAKVALGGDPAMDKENAQLAADNTVGMLIDQFLEANKDGWKPRTEVEIRRHLTKDVKPLHRMPITSVAQRNVANLLNDIAEEKGAVTANRVRASLCTFFGWVIREGIRLPEGNVAAYTNKREETSRDRQLSGAELKAVWNAAGDDDYGSIVKLLMLTGQRRDEIAMLRWNEISDEQITLPKGRTKNSREHVVPLSDPAKAVLEKLSDDDRTYVFGRDDTGFSGWSKAKEKLDTRLEDAGEELAPWTLHDLRRTAATIMAGELGVQPHIIEAILNHVSGHKGGVAGIYNRATYEREKREALVLWAEHLTKLVTGSITNVVPLRRAAG